MTRNLIAFALLTVTVSGCASQQCQVAPEAPLPLAQTNAPAHPVGDRVRGLANGCGFMLLHPVLGLAYALGAMPKC